MGLSADERRMLEELTAKANRPDVDEEFEIEIYDTAKNRGARIPFSQGKKWLFDSFGIGEAPAPAEGEGSGGEGGGAGGAPDGAATRGGAIFGRNRSGSGTGAA